MTPNAPQHPVPDDPEAHLPPHHNPLPELSGGQQKARISEEAFIEVQSSEEFLHLKKTFRGFAFPMTAAFLIWYFAYVLASVFARDFMSTPFLGENFNVGHFLGLLQFVTTFLITWLYIRHANTKLDPIAGKIRENLEGGAR
ncbi:MAG: DUF485 domain-containing protein [Actinomycetes bacterium]